MLTYRILPAFGLCVVVLACAAMFAAPAAALTVEADADGVTVTRASDEDGDVLEVAGDTSAEVTITWDAAITDGDGAGGCVVSASTATCPVAAGGNVTFEQTGFCCVPVETLDARGVTAPIGIEVAMSSGGGQTANYFATVHGGAGDDIVTWTDNGTSCDGTDFETCTMQGLVWGGAGDDVIQNVADGHGGAGDDRVWATRAWGDDGNDQVRAVEFGIGGSGADAVRGTISDNGDPNGDVKDSDTTRVYGGAGNDLLSAASNAWGGDGNDRIVNVAVGHGGPGRDTLTNVRRRGYGDGGRDTMQGGWFVKPAAGADPAIRYLLVRLWGGPGNDVVSRARIAYGGAGDDRIGIAEGRPGTAFCGTGFDRLFRDAIDRGIACERTVTVR